MGSELTSLVRGLSFFVRFFLNFLGVLVTRKEVENGEVRKGLKGFGSSVRVLVVREELDLLVLLRRRRQAMEVLDLITGDGEAYV